jgi:hypothetical protein
MSAHVAGPGLRYGIWTGHPDALRLVALADEPAPGAAPYSFRALFHSEWLEINPKGQIAFYDVLTEHPEGVGPFFASLWAANQSGGPELIARTGGTIVIDDMTRTIAELAMSREGLNDFGEYYFVAKFDDGSSALVVTVVPEPGAAPAVAVSTVLLRRRRIAGGLAST